MFLRRPIPSHLNFGRERVAARRNTQASAVCAHKKAGRGATMTRRYPEINQPASDKADNLVGAFYGEGGRQDWRNFLRVMGAPAFHCSIRRIQTGAELAGHYGSGTLDADSVLSRGICDRRDYLCGNSELAQRSVGLLGQRDNGRHCRRPIHSLCIGPRLFALVARASSGQSCGSRRSCSRHLLASAQRSRLLLALSCRAGQRLSRSLSGV